ncbi:Peroxidase 66 [Sesamum alatum]|uniref:Peroxidase n=1 Tax=Sesamum alatum TaxID=300844 RepID=A0AAE1YTB9_9LAMI|nr:Peroxidase 66 [Sesamum alatum]
MIYSLNVLLVVVRVSLSGAILDVNYYKKSCPEVEDIISTIVRNATVYDRQVPARILRMFFHDCFLRGCDASVLLDSTPDHKAEKDGLANLSLAGYYVIDDAKTHLEQTCPGTVSCADILAIAARDSVVRSGGPSWKVLKGRKDGRISIAEDTKYLPTFYSNTSQLIQSFSEKGLSVKDLVALSGAHTLGFSHCESFEHRLRNFSSAHDTDPTLDPQFAAELKGKCAKPNTDPNAGEYLDSSSRVFDNNYYKRVVGGKGIFESDQTLMGDYRTRWRVETFAKFEGLFFIEFARAMVRLGNVGVVENGEVRANCRFVN